MDPIHFPEATGSLGPPRGVSSNDCGDLPYQKGAQDGMSTITSVWQPTDLELIALKSGGKVKITMFAGSHPMISVGVYRRCCNVDVDDEGDTIRCYREEGHPGPWHQGHDGANGLHNWKHS